MIVFTGKKKDTRMPNGNKENAPLLTDYLWKNYASELNQSATKNNEITEVFPKVKFI